MRLWILWFLAPVALGSVMVISWKQVRTVSAKSEAMSCVPSATEQCPNEDFLRSYNRWILLRNKLGTSDGSESVVDRERASDEFQGLTSRLQGMVPKGSTFDEGKRRFLPVPVPASSVPPPPSATIKAPAHK